jgi:hypothetical protein
MTATSAARDYVFLSMTATIVDKAMLATLHGLSANLDKLICNGPVVG